MNSTPEKPLNNRTRKLLTDQPLPSLLWFALPIICGNIFQQLYNIVDAVVVGNYLGSLSLAGISVASPLMDVLYALVLGGCLGISVLTGQAFGAGDSEKLRRTHTTALLGGAAATLLLSAAGLAFSFSVLTAQGVSEETCAEAMRYLSIILLGLIFSFLYNYLAALLRSCGDSRSPFVVLLCSSTLHALLDVLLVGKLGLGIRGVACSTVFSQCFSSMWLFLILYRRAAAVETFEDSSPADREMQKALAVPLSAFRFEAAIGRSILAFSWAAALQQAVVCIGRLLVQGMLTGLGNEVLSGYNMGMRTEQFLFCFSQGISASMVVAISQNLGAGNIDRVRRFYKSAILSGLCLAVLLGGTCVLIPEKLIGIFSKDPAIIAAGVTYIGTMGFVYPFAFSFEMIQAFFRGLGKLRFTMAASITQIVLRVPLSAILIPRWQIRGICAAVITGWVMLTLLEGSYSLYTIRKKYS
ncbi:MAG: MATE family efflux transporter [Stomatobaculum sp.]|nr:MATE family efflux transporter [Stomatobaculum sp.]